MMSQLLDLLEYLKGRSLVYKLSQNLRIPGGTISSSKPWSIRGCWEILVGMRWAGWGWGPWRDWWGRWGFMQDLMDPRWWRLLVQEGEAAGTWLAPLMIIGWGGNLINGIWVKGEVNLWSEKWDWDSADPRNMIGLGWECCPSYVVITIPGSSDERSTLFFTEHLSFVQR